MNEDEGNLTKKMDLELRKLCNTYMGQKLQDGKKCSACHKTALTPRIVLAKRLALATCPFGLLDNYQGSVCTAIFTVLGAFLRAEKYF